MSNRTREILWSLRTLTEREIRRYLRIWVQTLVPPAVTMSLYFVIFGSLIGPRIGSMNGFDYIQFMIPGLIMMSVITNSYANVVSSFFGVKFQRSIEELLVSPMPAFIILLGFIIGGVSRGILVGIVVYLVSLFFYPDFTIHNLPLTLGVLVLTAILFSLMGFINAIFADTFDDISVVPTFVLTPLIYLGGVFYSISILPEIWQKVSLINPMLYVVNTFREGMLGVSDIDVTSALLMQLFFIIILTASCLYLLKTGKGTRQ
jgi:ABC-2 type transport system permease protein